MAAIRTPARYDGLSDWYDATGADWYADTIASLLGPGHGLCLDLGCGTGQHGPAIASTGHAPIGVDVSADQLRIARTRMRHVVQGSAEWLPFADGVFSSVVAIWVSTDIDDFAAAIREAARVLRPHGRLVVFGVHPCFNGPCVENRDDGARIVHPNYRQARWHRSAPWWGHDGIRRRVGMRHLPLSDLLTAVLAGGLSIERVEEPGPDAVPVARDKRITEDPVPYDGPDIPSSQRQPVVAATGFPRSPAQATGHRSQVTPGCQPPEP